MNILLVNKFYYLRGGAERSFFETQRMLETGGHRVIPFAMRDERNRPTPYAPYFVDKVEFNRDHSLKERIEIVPRIIYFYQARRRLEDLLRRERVDVAHLHNIAHQISPAILDSLRKFEVPVVQTLHDYKLICPTYTMMAKGRVCERCLGGNFYHAVCQRCNKGSLSASLLNAVEMYAHRALNIYRRGIDLFISPSRFLRRKLLEGGVRRTPIFYLPNALNLEQYVPSYGGQDYCVYFGRLSAEKGVDTLIQAMRQMDEFRLLVVGDGLQRRELENLAGERQLHNVEFLGPLFDEDLKRVVSQAQFVVLPSQCYENCPFSVLESFALGKPVVGARIGGIPELITEGRDGLLFEPGNTKDLKTKMEYLIHHREVATEMGISARKKAECRYGLQTHYRGLLSAYSLALDSTGASRERFPEPHRRPWGDDGEERLISQDSPRSAVEP